LIVPNAPLAVAIAAAEIERADWVMAALVPTRRQAGIFGLSSLDAVTTD
jgi:hypothetical protein